jgi:hypothetical protein
MLVVLMLGAAVWAGVSWVLDKTILRSSARQERRSLVDRLAPYAQPSVADEAQQWLSQL